MELAVEPVLQVKPELQLEAVKTVLSPAHIDCLEAAITGSWPVPTDIEIEPVPEQVPVPQITEYVVVEVGETVIVLAVEPVLQVKPELQLEAVKTVLSPAQTVCLVAVITGAWAVPMVIVFTAVPLQVPEPHVTEYVVVAVGVTVMLAVVKLLLHNIFPEQLTAVNVTGLPAQTVFAVAVIVGFDWPEPTVTVTMFEVLLV
jgi:hypothetical protein